MHGYELSFAFGCTLVVVLAFNFWLNTKKARNGLMISKDMEGLAFFYLLMCIFGGGFLLWMKTPKGKKWLEEL